MTAPPTLTAPMSKRRKVAPLHAQHVAPYSFLEEAVEGATEENYFAEEKFGIRKEAFVRKAYQDISELIHKKWQLKTSEGKNITLAIVQGSSGVGKSVFLAYVIARYRKGDLKNLALFHAPKTLKSGTGSVNNDEVICSVWLDGQKRIKGKYRDVRGEVENQLSGLDLIIMDGCSMPIDFASADFTGLILVSASPSLYVKNLQDAFPTNHWSFTMPPISKEESVLMAEIVGVDEDLVEENYTHMNGVPRYLFEKDAAKLKVNEAIKSVSASSISNMVSMQSTSKREEQVAVHSLVLWKVHNDQYRETPTYSLVSRYAEQLVAKKIARETSENLRAARQMLGQLSGAQGYAGALFEAYAIRILQDGGQFNFRKLGNADVITENLSLEAMEKEPIEIEGNELTTHLVSFDQLRVSDGKPRLLWPTTTNFPTFDCFYFHPDGTAYLLQMTISKKHPLKNSGARNAKAFFDKMFGKKKPEKYKAVLSSQMSLSRITRRRIFRAKLMGRWLIWARILSNGCSGFLSNRDPSFKMNEEPL